MIHQRPIRRSLIILGVAALPAAMLSCSQSALLNAWAPAADISTATGAQASRTIQIGFINNTPYRAIFTFGAYDQLDNTTLPTGFLQLRVEGLTTSNQVAQPCRKTFSVGGDELIRLINENRNDPNISAGITNENALVRGINFSSAPLGDPLQDQPTEGTAEGRVVLNGVDFSCRRNDIRETTASGLLLFTFVQDAASPGGFRIDYSFVSP